MAERYSVAEQECLLEKTRAEFLQMRPDDEPAGQAKQ
jgi:hypothetical protein